MINADCKTIDYFQELIADPQNCLLEQAVDEGLIPIGYTCSYVPVPLLSADRLVPVRVRAPGIAGTETADNYLSSVICSYTRSLLEFAIDGRYDLFKGWVFVASCDHLRRLWDNLVYLKKPVFNHMLDMPHKTGEAGVRWYIDEVRTLSERLASHFGVDMSDRSIEASIKQYNEFNTLLKSIGELRKKERPPISGTDFHRIVMASQVAPMRLLEPYVRKYRDELGEGNGGREYRARLMVAGGELDDPDYLHIIESQGGVVVADRFCTGSIPGLDPVPLTGDPLKDAAEHVFTKTLCPRMMEDFDARVNKIIETVKEYRVDGVIIQIVKFCDIWGVESGPLVSALRDAGIPVLKLEREYRLGGEGQLRTRVQAFLESMGR
jgi:benzoyl-CoA reductase/2-hydroxyglutaryl-CoA dehydratase subunit BcrC/BadD/HgdB